jgi:hypothetical protein
MQLPQIRLQQTYAHIGLRITQPIQEIQQKPAELSIKQESAKMSIENKPSQLKLDDEQFWDDLGFKSIPTILQESAQNGRESVLEYIGTKAQEGDQLAKIENKSDAIVGLITEKLLPQKADFNIGFIPSPGSVKIQFTPAELHIDWKKGGADIQVTPNNVVHHYTPGKTEVYLQQRQQLQIDFVGTNINYKT